MTQPSKHRASAPDKRRSLGGRQYVRFAAYKIDGTWRRLRPEKQAQQKEDFVRALESLRRKVLVRPYSTMGTRADAELLLWEIAESLDALHEVAAVIAGTELGAHLHMTHSFLSQTKRSVYVFPDVPEGEAEQLTLQSTDARYVFVYPFLKTREWYHLTMATRQGMMNEHVEIGRRYPSVQLNTTYSFGLDDQEFVVAFETDEPSDFLDLVQDLRETQASLYTLRDVPLFTGIRMRLAEALDALGGPPIAGAIPEETETGPDWVDAGPEDELKPGDRKLVFVGSRQVAVFNVEGALFAVDNRCPHARGPLNEGETACDADGRCTVSCPWHDARFDLETGEVVDGIATRPIAPYPVEVRDGRIYVGKAVHEYPPLRR